LDPEDRAQGRLAQAEGDLLADRAEALRERDGGGGLPLAGLRRRDRRDADELAVRLVLQALEDVEGDLRLVLAEEVVLVRLEAGVPGDLRDWPKLGLLGDLEAGRHVRGQIGSFS